MTQKERQAQSRKEILQASLEEFGAVGYAQATVDSICARRHISKGMMYHYYKGKDDLFLLCAADMFEKLSAFLAAHEPDAADAQPSAFASLAAYYQCREAFFTAHPAYWKVFENAMLYPPAHLESRLRALRAPVWEHNRRFLQRVTQQYPLRDGLGEEQVIRYLESVDYAFQVILERYDAKNEARGFRDMLCLTDEILDMLLFGVMKPQ